MIDKIQQRETTKLRAYVYSQVHKHLQGIENNPLVLEYIIRHALVNRAFLKSQTYERLDELILDCCLLVVSDEALQAKIKSGKAPAICFQGSYFEKDGGGVQIVFGDSDDDIQEITVD